ncbi:MAG: hemerythrin domain-containing protein [bacterium]
MDQTEFEELFKEEHQSILQDTERLIRRIENSTSPDIEDEIDTLNDHLGPHFRYEEEALYPSLEDQYGRIYVKRLYDSHEGTIYTLRKLREMVVNNSLNQSKALELIYGWLLPHVSDCEGLSIMVDQIPSVAIDEITRARERANSENLDLLTWADRERGEPDFGTLTIYD